MGLALGYVRKQCEMTRAVCYITSVSVPFLYLMVIGVKGGGGNEMFGFIKSDHNSRIVYGPMANKNVCIVAVLVSLN